LSWGGKHWAESVSNSRSNRGDEAQISQEFDMGFTQPREKMQEASQSFVTSAANHLKLD
jgi:hypothetical protein